jgi:ferrochelatase
MAPQYDAVLVVSFGGPEGPDDVVPFLQNVTRGRNIPPERLAVVGRHYERFGGVSPINAENRALIAALERELAARGPQLPVYWGNRNWHPLLGDTMATMAADGVQRALAFVTSGFGGYSSCRQYLEDIERARQSVGDGAPVVDKIRLFFNHPGFIGPVTERVAAAMADHPGARLVFTAHSVPLAVASVAPYVAQLRDAAGLVARDLPGTPEWDLAFQSRSGPPTQPWLEPDIVDHLASVAAGGADTVVVCPLGFVSDHLEVVYDLDVQAAEAAARLGLRFVRVPAPGTALAPMVRDLIAERVEGWSERPVLGGLGPWPDVCPPGHCIPA